MIIIKSFLIFLAAFANLSGFCFSWLLLSIGCSFCSMLFIVVVVSSLAFPFNPRIESKLFSSCVGSTFVSTGCVVS